MSDVLGGGGRGVLQIKIIRGENGWMVGGSVGWSVGRLICRLVGWQVGWSAGWLVGRQVGESKTFCIRVCRSLGSVGR
jgi:hypothetical protein